MLGRHPAVAARPAMDEAGRHGHEDDAHHAGPGARATDPETRDGRDGGGDDDGRPAFEEADQRDGGVARVDEDAVIELNARAHEDHGEHPEPQPQHDGLPASLRVGLPLEQPADIGIEEEADDEETDGLEDVVDVHAPRATPGFPVRLPVCLPSKRGRSSRRNLPV